ncbi:MULTISPECIES: histidine phosphatase family protein [unclassified Novosphingobium]|uniref:histidine phosphatase family protein n=1 Tax=unclassified Novosphingobium TaxID=2644732 RepID=UPI00146A51EB|nr:alpha-ribazole phosphatase [Novosphingobium sp. SG919]NMN88491.1 alpha-ribazole phosphatase [Novosphingobium sp. SG916]
MTAFLLHLLRHGAPEQAGLLLGHRDMAATAEGLAACVSRAQGLRVAKVITSDLQRCRAAAQAIAAPLGLVAKADPRWRELDFGAWDGMAPAQIEPAALAAFYRDPDAHAPPGGEPWSALRVRVADALAALAPVDTLVVTHGGAMRAALAALCGFSPEQAWAFDLPYAGLLSLKVWPVKPRVAQIVGLAA